jgi:Fe2+ or Zn2+ uptake regulation protein
VTTRRRRGVAASAPSSAASPFRRAHPSALDPQPVAVVAPGRPRGADPELRDGSTPWPYTGRVRDADALAADLHARGLRVTPQRQLIYSLLAQRPSHPTVEAVHDAVRAVLPTVSLRTVYQALHDLEAMGDIRLVQVGTGPLRVDTMPEHHGHLLCTGCGRLDDVDVDLSGLVLPVEQRRGFAVADAEVVFSGRCPTCAAHPDVISS